MFLSSRQFLIPALALGAALAFAACNTTDAKDDAGTPGGGGDFDVAAGVRYGDTGYTPTGYLLQSFDTLRADDIHLDTLGFMVQGGNLKHIRGTDTVTSFGSSVQVYVGVRPAVSATYDVRGNWAHGPSVRSGMIGKASIFVSNNGLDWSHPDSSAGAKVKVVVTGDSIQVVGKNIKLKSGKSISFNLTTKKTWNP